MSIETYTIGNATLYCGDCRDIIDSLTFDAIVTDPPYGMAKIYSKQWKEFGKRKTKRTHKNLQSGGTWATKDIYKDIDWDDEAPDVTFLIDRNVPTMIFGGNLLANLPPSRKWIVWDKGEQFYNRTFAEAELCYCNFDGNTRIFKCTRTREQKVHPTQKPVKLMRFCILELPKDTGSVICDPYMGSGTTGIAAIQIGKAFIGIEQRKDYFDTACRRIERAHADYENLLPEIKMEDKQKSFTAVR